MLLQNRVLSACLLMLGALIAPPVAAEPPGTNYDESKIPDYTLPDPLLCEDGSKVEDASVWWSKRRPEILELFQTQVYGRSPEKPANMRFRVTSTDDKALGGKATRKEVSIVFGDRERPRIDLLIYLPNNIEGPVPAFMALNFYGNHTIHADPGITLSDQWMRSSAEKGIVDNRATEASRGKSASRWAVDEILDRGYALIAIYCGDIDPDFDDGFHNGVHSLYREDDDEKPAPDQWGTIAAWAWGLSRGLDYLETDKDIDATRVAVMGHSRLGKTSLWAGASDPRFALVISNNSGCGGAALSRRRIGETVGRINSSFPHWFCDNFNQYNNDEDDLPIDQHQLIALIAPRPVYVASATLDRWADPRGEFLSAYHAEPVYRLLGAKGLGTAEMPAENTSVGDTIGYHLRTGKHDVTDYDWQQYLNFADRHLKK